METSKKFKLPRVNLLVKILIAIVLGIATGFFFPMGVARLFATFNAIFSEFLNLCIPLIILGFVAPAIVEIGDKAGKMLIFTVVLAYVATICSGLMSYFTADSIFPSLITGTANLAGAELGSNEVAPFFTIKIEAPISVMTALVLSFILGVVGSSGKTKALNQVMFDLRDVISVVIAKAIIPILPIYIYGIFLSMTISGNVVPILSTFASIIGVIFVLHVAVLLLQFTVASFFSRKSRNPLKLLWTMMPAYFTALGTSSSAATIPVTLKQTIKMGVDKDVAGFTVPLCATIHMSGSTLKIVACALAMMLLSGTPYTFGMFMGFISLLAVTMVAAPGVPGGAIMAALGVLTSVLGFTESQCALMIALYITMDSFGTACNVTGDGALSIIVSRFFGKAPAPAAEAETPIPANEPAPAAEPVAAF